MNTDDSPARPLRLLFAPFGSEGDIAPFLYLADRLVARGHTVRIATNPHFASIVRNSGHPFVPAGDGAKMRASLDDPRMWSSTEGSKLLLEGLIASLPSCVAPFLQEAPQPDLIVGSTFAIAAATVAEARKIPFVRLHLQPSALRSVGDMPVLGPSAAWLRRLPVPLIRMLYGLIDLHLDKKPMQRINQFRATLTLPPLRSFYRDICTSGAASGGLFPPWFAPAQPDWPAGMRLFDFVLDDRRPELPARVRDFIALGEPPVLWTHGSANFHTAEFVRAAEAASRDQGLRAIVVTSRFDSALPPASDGVLRLEYAPFTTLLPHCRAVVHHGGVGTFSKALRAGVPQLIVPRAFDQFDNAARIERLGLGLSVDYRHRDRIERVLAQLLSEPQFAQRARAFSNRHTGAPELVPWLESIAVQR